MDALVKQGGMDTMLANIAADPEGALMNLRGILDSIDNIDDIAPFIRKMDAFEKVARSMSGFREAQIVGAAGLIESRMRAAELYAALPDEPRSGNNQYREETLTAVNVSSSPKKEALSTLGVTAASMSQWSMVKDELGDELPAMVAEALDNKDDDFTYSQVRKKATGKRKEKVRSEKKATIAARQPEPEAPFVNLFVAEAQRLVMIDDGTVDVIITSPPYNLGDDTWPMGGNGRETRDGMEYSLYSDTMTQVDYEAWQLEVFAEMYRVAKVGASFFYNHKPRTLNGRIIHPVQWLCRPENPWTVRQEIIWDRTSTHNHSAQLFWPHDERIYWMTKGRPNLNEEPIGMPTIWREFGPVASTWHPAPFTIELPRMLLKAIHVAPGAVVLDPFAGSCTTLRAALELGCEAVGTDIDGDYLRQAAQENGWRYAL